jgi:hypothetical protein
MTMLFAAVHESIPGMHECDLRAALSNVRSWESSGLDADAAFGPFMTNIGPRGAIEEAPQRQAAKRSAGPSLLHNRDSWNSTMSFWLIEPMNGASSGESCILGLAVC